MELFYKEFLRIELKKRIAKNPRYSMRAFSKALEIDPGAMSRLLSGKQGITLLTAAKICRKLKLDQSIKESFMNSVGCDTPKSIKE
jgi:plasmid maintenance system antidote protein VapI